MSRRRARTPGQAGMTLVELMIAMLLTGILCSAILAAFIVTDRTDRQTGQDSQALASLRLVNDRIAKELRQARRVYSDSTGAKLHIWVDGDRDNQQDPSERITFAITTNSGGAAVAAGTTSTITRVTDAPGAVKIPIATNMQLFPASATFVYSPSYTSVASPSTVWTDVTLVSMTIASDDAPGPFPAPRTLKTDMRLRNATTY